MTIPSTRTLNAVIGRVGPGFTDRHGNHVMEGDRVSFGFVSGTIQDILQDGDARLDLDDGSTLPVKWHQCFLIPVKDYVLKLQELHNSLIRALANNSTVEMHHVMRVMRITINECLGAATPVPPLERTSDVAPPVEWPRDLPPRRQQQPGQRWPRPPCFAGHLPPDADVPVTPPYPPRLENVQPADAGRYYTRPARIITPTIPLLPNNSPLGDDDENYYGGHGDGGF